MRLAVFGASGRSGRPLVEAALAAGHAVRALVRDPAKLGALAPGVEVVRGDALDPAGLAQTVQGTDAVLDVLGPVKGSPDDLLAVHTRQLIKAMRGAGVRRLIVLGGAGVRVAQDHPGLDGRIIAWLLGRLVIPAQVRDKAEQLRLLAASDLDWTVLRAPVLTDGPATGRFTVGYPAMGFGARITRADVASALLAQLDDGRWLREAPAVRS